MLNEIKTFTGFIGEENAKGFDDLTTLLDKKINEYLTSDNLKSIKHEVISNTVVILPSTTNRTEGLLYQLIVRYSQI